MSTKINAFRGMPVKRLAFALSGSHKFLTNPQIVFSSFTFLFYYLASTYMSWHNRLKL